MGALHADETEAMRAAIRRHVAEEVRAELARKRIPQVAIGRQFGISQGAINRRMLGVIPFDVEELMWIAAVTGRDVGSFFPPLDSATSGPLAQLAELRTFNPNGSPSLRLITARNRTGWAPLEVPGGPALRIVGRGPR